MITADKHYLGLPDIPCEVPLKLWGLSTDTKPTENIPNGSRYAEINTGNVFCFDAENKIWYPW